jgi:hypothetical protein
LLVTETAVMSLRGANVAHVAWGLLAARSEWQKDLKIKREDGGAGMARSSTYDERPDDV